MGPRATPTLNLRWVESRTRCLSLLLAFVIAQVSALLELTAPLLTPLVHRGSRLQSGLSWVRRPPPSSERVSEASSPSPAHPCGPFEQYIQCRMHGLLFTSATKPDDPSLRLAETLSKSVARSPPRPSYPSLTLPIDHDNYNWAPIEVDPTALRAPAKTPS